MKEELVSFETAKLAREKGFNWECQNAYDENGEIDNSVDLNGQMTFTQEDLATASENDYDCYFAPTQSLLQKWLREIHNIEMNIAYPDGFWKYIVHNNFGKNVQNGGIGFPTYESALEEGLQQALKTL